MRRTARLFRAAAVAALAAAGGSALAQDIQPAAGRGAHCPPAHCPPAHCPPGVAPAQPYYGQVQPQYAPGSPAATLTAPPAAAATATAEAAPSFAGTLAGAGLGATTAVNPAAYIDGAIPVDVIRLRYDMAYRNNRPDRAEFFYPKCGCFRTLTPPQLDAKGPPLPETRVDYQEFSTYVEKTIGERFSIFGEMPLRAINPTVNDNVTGIGDVSFGLKYAAILTECQAVTLQFRTITPSGDGDKGLGTENWWLNPGLLWQTQAADRLTLFGEVQDFLPISRTSNFAGNVLRFGAGLAYMAVSTERVRVMPVFESVGWWVLSGRQLADGQDIDAIGDTIVNVKGGVRIGLGKVCDPGDLGRSDLYLGYGRAVTGDVWYKDLFRVEYRLRY
jgi:hypothetical protein